MNLHSQYLPHGESTSLTGEVFGRLKILEKALKITVKCQQNITSGVHRNTYSYQVTAISDQQCLRGKNRQTQTDWNTNSCRHNNTCFTQHTGKHLHLYDLLELREQQLPCQMTSAAERPLSPQCQHRWSALCLVYALQWHNMWHNSYNMCYVCTHVTRAQSCSGLRRNQ